MSSGNKGCGSWLINGWFVQYLADLWVICCWFDWFVSGLNGLAGLWMVSSFTANTFLFPSRLEVYF